MSQFYMAPDVGTSTRRASSQPSFTRGNDNMKLAMKFLNAPPVTYVIGKDQISIRVAAAAPVEAPIAFKIRSYDSILRQLEINKGRLSANEIVAAMSNHFDINTNVSEARSDRIRDLVRREIYNVENLQGIALLDVAGAQVTEKPHKSPHLRPDGIAFIQVSARVEAANLSESALTAVRPFRSTFCFRLPTDFPAPPFPLPATIPPLIAISNLLLAPSPTLPLDLIELFPIAVVSITTARIATTPTVRLSDRRHKEASMTTRTPLRRPLRLHPPPVPLLPVLQELRINRDDVTTSTSITRTTLTTKTSLHPLSSVTARTPGP